MTEFNLFSLGVGVALASMIPAAVALLLVVRHCLRVAEIATLNRDQWQEAAAGASIAAAVSQDQLEQQQSRQSKTKVAGGIHSIWHGEGESELCDGEDEDCDDDTEDRK